MAPPAFRFRSPLDSRTALAALTCVASIRAHAAPFTSPSLESLATHGGWMLLAAVGLVAVVVAAYTVRRSPRDGRSLMEMTTQLREPSLEPRAASTSSTGADAGPPANDGTAEAAHEERPGPMLVERAEAMPESGERADPMLEPVGRTEPMPAPVAPAEPMDVPSERAMATQVTRSVDAAPVPSPANAVCLAPWDAALRATWPDVPSDGSQLFLALHHVDLSIDVLRRHLQRETRPMPAVWVMLLDLARTHGREQTFRDLAAEFHQRFNVRTPAWDGYPPDRGEPGLEAHPRLVKEITLAWGTHECGRLLDRLLYDNRGGNRTGFTLNAYNDLIALRRAANAVIDTIEQDLAEEAKVRSAFASASAELAADEDAKADRSPLVRDLESELDRDLRVESGPASALEAEHPALAGMLAREWGNAALSARLCEMLARGGDGAHALSPEAAAELELLRAMAERLASINGITLMVD